MSSSSEEETATASPGDTNTLTTMATPSTAGTRRSNRQRKRSSTIYDEAKMQSQQTRRRVSPKRKKTPARKKKQKDDESDSDSDDDDSKSNKSDNEEDESTTSKTTTKSSVKGRSDNDDGASDSESSTSSSESEASVAARIEKRQRTPAAKKTKKKSVTTPATTSTKKKRPIKTRTITVKHKLDSARAKKTATRGIGKAATKKSLNALKTKVLDPKETPQNSLVAAVFKACTGSTTTTKKKKKTTKKKKKKDELSLDDDSDEDEDTDIDSDDDDMDDEDLSTPIQYPTAFVETDYTAVLEPIAKRMLMEYQKDPNRGHVQFLNFIFRSVGGSYKNSTLDAAVTDLEEMDDDQWEEVVTAIVDDMRHTPADSILISSSQKGAVYKEERSKALKEAQKQAQAQQNAPQAQDPVPADIKQSVAQQEYRRIYDHFWYLLGTVALSGFGHKTTTSSSGGASSASFDIERVRDLACRMMELVTVGQPDLRSAACQSALMLALAACDGTLEFATRLAIAQRQLNAAKAAKTKTHTKQKALEQQVSGLERSLADLTQVVVNTIVPGVFMRRYRDSDPYIRASALETLSQMILRRPDIFLKDIYLKYYGWMMSDKDSVVRVAALKGMLMPFVIAKQQDDDGDNKNIHPLQVINLSEMEKVIGKFLPRIADCVVDVSVEVQGQAMKLLVALMRQGFMDDVEDEKVWTRVNLRALAEETSPEMRKDCLYFVIEQLECFDIPNTSKPTEEQKVFQIGSLAVWMAHALSDGRIPLEHLRVNLVDFVVESLRDMPEHSHLATDWPCMIKAIQSDIETKVDKSSHQRVTASKERVLLRMLAIAAELEFGSSTGNNAEDDDGDDSNGNHGFVDDQLIEARECLRPSIPVVTPNKKGGGKKKKQQQSASMISQESLTVGLLKALPRLLEAFRGNISTLRSLTSLPRFFVSSVITLPQRKQDVQALINLLGEAFLETTDVTILQNICLALSVLAKGDHARNREALLKLKSLALTIQDKLFLHYEQEDDTLPTNPTGASSSIRRLSMTPETRATQDTNATGTSTTMNTGDAQLDKQHGICLALTRLRILSKKWYLGVLLARDPAGNDESITEEEADPSIHLCATVAKKLATELKMREFKVPEDSDDDESTSGSLDLPEIWQHTDPRVHRVVSATVGEGLQLILSITAWRTKRAINKELRDKEKAELEQDSDEESDDEDDAKTMGNATVGEVDFSIKQIKRSQQGLVKLIILCFDNHLEDGRVARRLSPEHKVFSKSVQFHAGQAAADLRTLFPPYWSDLESRVMRNCAFAEDAHLIGGFVRFIRAVEDGFENSPEGGRLLKEKIILPLSRGVVSNWKGNHGGNRREAAAALNYIAHPVEDVSKASASTNKTFKRLNPGRLLECQYTSLIQSYNDWIESEPAEPDSDRPTEEELLDFQAAEHQYEEDFKILEHMATKFSASLGVGKLNDKMLLMALKGFFREGIKFSFSTTSQDGDEDDFFLGSHLTFLKLIAKFLTFVKKNKDVLKDVTDLFLEKEEELRSDAEFSEVRAEDVDCLDVFARALGLARKPKKKTKKIAPAPAAVPTVEGSDSDSYVSPVSRSSNKRRLSQASATSSIRSVRSNNLSPLYEEESEDDDVPIQTLKKRKLTPAAKETIKEESDEGSLSSASASP